MKREVRGDQHGTTTGYAYGCRCVPCSQAHRQQRAEYTSVASEAHEALVLAALEHEADMDGVVTASGPRLCELTGVSHVTANLAVNQLIKAGRIRQLGRVGLGGVRMVELVDGAE